MKFSNIDILRLLKLCTSAPTRLDIISACGFDKENDLIDDICKYSRVILCRTLEELGNIGNFDSVWSWSKVVLALIEKPHSLKLFLFVYKPGEVPPYFLKFYLLKTNRPI